MKLENQVISLETAKKLKELGVKQESLFTWVEDTKTGLYKLISFVSPWYSANTDYFCAGFEDIKHPMYAAFTVAELGEMLPENIQYVGTIHTFKVGGRFCCGLQMDGQMKDISQIDETETDARGKLLICLLEHNLITIKE